MNMRLNHVFLRLSANNSIAGPITCFSLQCNFLLRDGAPHNTGSHWGPDQDHFILYVPHAYIVGHRVHAPMFVLHDFVRSS